MKSADQQGALVSCLMKSGIPPPFTMESRMKKLLLVFVALCLPAPSFAAEVALRKPGPCRVIDTRATSSPVAADDELVISLDPGDAASQGGTAGCGVPEMASAVRLNIKAMPTSVDYGYIKVFDASTEGDEVFNTLNFQDVNRFTAAEVEVPLSTRAVGLYAYVEAHVVADIVGWVLDCHPEDSWDFAYSSSQSSISVPETGDIDLLKYADGGSIWVGGAASQPGLYEITGSATNNGRQRLYVTPTPQAATDVALEVHPLPGGCSPREVALDGAN